MKEKHSRSRGRELASLRTRPAVHGPSEGQRRDGGVSSAGGGWGETRGGARGGQFVVDGSIIHHRCGYSVGTNTEIICGSRGAVPLAPDNEKRRRQHPQRVAAEKWKSISHRVTRMEKTHDARLFHMEGRCGRIRADYNA